MERILGHTITADIGLRVIPSLVARPPSLCPPSLPLLIKLIKLNGLNGLTFLLIL